MEINNFIDLQTAVTNNISGLYEVTGEINFTSNIILPNGVVLKYSGGLLKINNYTLTGNNTNIDCPILQFFQFNLGNIAGTWLMDNVKPEWFGAKGDGVVNDYRALNVALSLRKEVILQSGRTYNFSSTLYAYNSIIGDATLVITASTLTHGLVIDSVDYFELKGFSLRSTIKQNLYGKGKYGIHVKNSSMFNVSNVDVSFFTDALSIDNCKSFEIRSSEFHNVGEEPIVIRYSSLFNVENNDCYEHNGDGILIKGNIGQGGSIMYNRIRDGVNIYGWPQGMGGGITCNTEDGNVGNLSNLRIIGNEINNVNYGIYITGLYYFNISSNIISNMKKLKGIAVDNVGINYNPESINSGYGIIGHNIIRDIKMDEGIVVLLTGGDFVNKPVIVIGNTIIMNSATSTYAMRVENSTVTANHIYGGSSSIVAKDSSVVANLIFKTDRNNDSGIKLFGKSSFNGNVVDKDYNSYIHVRADFNGSIVGNTITSTTTQNVITVMDGAFGIISGNNVTNLGTGGRVNKIDGISIDSYTSDKKLIQTRSSVPTSGTWNQGDIIYNTFPSPGQFVGWVCVTSGTPGTWKGFGVIQV